MKKANPQWERIKGDYEDVIGFCSDIISTVEMADKDCVDYQKTAREKNSESRFEAMHYLLDLVATIKGANSSSKQKAKSIKDAMQRIRRNMEDKHYTQEGEDD